MAYEYKKTDDNIPFREIAELGKEGWLAACNIATDETILWVRELQDDEKETKGESETEDGQTTPQ